MNATPPEAKSEYSRGLEQPGGGSAPKARRDSAGRRGRSGDGAGSHETAARAIVAGGSLGALLLLVSEFTTLFTVHSGAASAPIKSVGTGSHHTFALIPIALLVMVLTYGVWTAVSRPALLSIGILGVIALLIALLGDLPDAHASGLLGSAASHFTTASSTPSAGFYMETLGAVVLLITSVCGFLLLGPPVAQRTPPRPDRVE